MNNLVLSDRYESDFEMKLMLLYSGSNPINLAFLTTNKLVYQ